VEIAGFNIGVVMEDPIYLREETNEIPGSLDISRFV
jgi:hypothetical protein